ncbi:hypothetical protein Adt_18625 [Abeliophyllum distichum]|uniref:Uncharacterized protein n=1 Tax=Abeliophyllum distichum TaxID=126358 RepID=A0ABD1TJW6_9LAMI
MSFGMEAVLPVEILSKTSRLNVEQLNPVATYSELDLLEWVRERSAIKNDSLQVESCRIFQTSKIKDVPTWRFGAQKCCCSWASTTQAWTKLERTIRSDQKPEKESLQS